METRALFFLLASIVSSQTSPLFDCDFEKQCHWIWTRGLERVNGRNLTVAGTGNHIGPRMDSTGNADGHFLYLPGFKEATDRVFNVTSPKLNSSDSTCRLVFMEHSFGVRPDAIKIVFFQPNQQSVIIDDKYAHATNRWERNTQRLGVRNSPFQIVIEFVPSVTENSHLAIDDIHLENCFPDPVPAAGSCDTRRHFECSGKCIEKSQVCDLHTDCPNGEDEAEECDKIPNHAKCNFEMKDDIMCGWSNDQTDHLDWIRHQGHLDDRGPAHDYTYKNSSGHFLYLNTRQNLAKLGDHANLNSASFPTPPKCHGQIHSPFYNSCQVRFAYFMHGLNVGSLSLNCIEKPPGRDAKETILWRMSGKKKYEWIRAVVSLPKLLYEYRLQFVGSRGLRHLGYIALDDITLSPECFGIGINETENENQERTRPKPFPPTLKRLKFDTCGAKGRFGPTKSMCNNSYSLSGITVDVLEGENMNGIQAWTVNKTGFYSVIAQGASGGKGARTQHTSHGARVRAVFKWSSGDVIHMLMGQEGSSTCQWGHCKQPLTLQEDIRGLSRVRTADLMNKGSGGGGGGATYVFEMDDSGVAHPLLVAGGGGGFSLDEPLPDALNPDARGFNKSAGSRAGIGPRNGAGGGGGWNWNLDTNSSALHPSRGLSLLEGGVGGPPCPALAHWEANGGFGGGGGACNAGGGGGGYVGGDVADPDHSDENGQGGASWVSTNTYSISTGLVEGPGKVEIFAAFEGCGCSFLCVVLDWDANEHSCICDENWQLASDNVSCTAPSGVDRAVIMGMPRHLLIILVCVVVLMICIGTATFFLYHRYRRQKVKNLRQELFGNAELQLNRLRQQTGGMVTEYNPNYEFGGSTCTIQDLKEVPRESLTLVKALGQGAFGEVYQGCLHNSPGESRDLPVAVKTLPEFSSSQAEMDFLMEALIMSKFNHPNIVRFIGVCFEKLPKFIVLELLPGGDLKSFLRESRPKPDRPSPLNMCDLLRLAIDVARGCQYLEENHFIHRDIAARNCLLSSRDVNGIVKIADFGMARDIYRADYYRKGGKAMLPVKWMPPEAFLDGIFTSKTDVWSFGVLLWEVMSLGYMPYPGRGNQEVMQLVTSGGRLEPPNNCPGPVYHIMVQCWTSVPDDRPNFSTILERLGYCLQDPDVISAALPVFHRPPSMERDTTVMRPPDSEDRFLHVQRPSDSEPLTPASTDYLIPIPASNYSFSTERTDLASSVDSIDKLLELDEPRVPNPPAPSPANAPNGGSTKKRTGGYTSIPTFDENNMKTPNKSSLALDPSILAKQHSGRPFPYMNVATSDVTNSKEQKVDPFIIGNHFTENEVNC